jgi:hypothetical protein
MLRRPKTIRMTLRHAGNWLAGNYLFAIKDGYLTSFAWFVER